VTSTIPNRLPMVLPHRPSHIQSLPIHSTYISLINKCTCTEISRSPRCSQRTTESDKNLPPAFQCYKCTNPRTHTIQAHQSSLLYPTISVNLLHPVININVTTTPSITLHRYAIIARAGYRGTKNGAVAGSTIRNCGTSCSQRRPGLYRHDNRA